MKNARIFGIVAAPLLLLMALTATLRLSVGPAEAEDVPDPVSLRPGRGKRPPRPAPAPIVPADAATQKELERVALGQMRAIRKSDWPAALTFATPRFRATTTPEGFGQMIEANYSEMARAIKEKFDRAQVSGEFAHLRVEITLPDSDRYTLAYDLMKQGDVWNIISCTPATLLMDTPPKAPTGNTRI